MSPAHEARATETGQTSPVHPRTPVRTILELRRRQHLSTSTARALGADLYAHRCPSSANDSHISLCAASKRLQMSADEVGCHLDSVVHHGNYDWTGTGVLRLLRITKLSLRTSVGRSKFPWLWVGFNQVLGVFPLALLGQALGGISLAVAAIIVGLVARLPYRVTQLSGRLEGLVRAVGPDKRVFRASRQWTLAATLASVAETIPILVLVLGIALLLSGNPEALAGLSLGALVTLGLTATFSAFLYLRLGKFFPQFPDVRQALRVSGQFVTLVAIAMAWLSSVQPNGLLIVSVVPLASMFGLLLSTAISSASLVSWLLSISITTIFLVFFGWPALRRDSSLTVTPERSSSGELDDDDRW